MQDKIIEIQKKVCKAFNCEYVPSQIEMVVGIQPELKTNIELPINGLRHPIEYNSTGWYIWRGEEFPEKFVPLHVNHLREWCPEVLQFLGLPPGYRFLTDGKGYHDVWQDLHLLNI